MILRARRIDHNARRFVIRHVDDILDQRRNFDDSLTPANTLVLVTF